MAGDVTVDLLDDVVLINKDAGEATGVDLPDVTTRRRPITIKDKRGDAATNNITINPASSSPAQTIDGLSSWVIAFDRGGVTLHPDPDGLGWNVM